MSAAAAMTPTRRPASRAMRVSASLYVAAWLAGLSIAPSGPGLDAGAAEVQAHVAGNASALMVQAGLVHGLAGVAFIGFVLALTRGARASRARLAGIAAGMVSVVQFGVLVVAAASAVGADASAASVSGLMHAIDLFDTAKLVLLATTIALTTRVLVHPRWLRRLGVTLVVLLPVSGSAFVLGSRDLYMLLYLALPLLLLWVASTAIVSRPR